MELKQIILESINNAVNNHPIQYGDRLYVVRRRLSSSGGVRIDSPCPVCGGKRKINYKGYELDCTYCSKSGFSNDYIYLYDYELYEYIVNGIKVFCSGDYTKKSFGKSIKMPRVGVGSTEAFCKYGRSFDDVDDLTIYNGDIYQGETANFDCDNDLGKVFIFRDKKTAREMLSLVHDAQRKMLHDFNEKYGTDHTYPFTED